MVGGSTPSRNLANLAFHSSDANGKDGNISTSMVISPYAQANKRGVFYSKDLKRFIFPSMVINRDQKLH